MDSLAECTTRYSANSMKLLEAQSLFILLPVVFGGLFYPPLPVTVAEPGVIYRNSFDDDLSGVYTPKLLRLDWNAPKWEDGVSEGRVFVVDGGEAHAGHSLRVRHPANSLEASEWILRLPAGREDIYASYWVKFDEQFDFVKEGKVGGLCGGACNSGGLKPNGRDGFEAIVLWGENGAVNQYVYHPDQATEYGDVFQWNWGGQRYFKPGEWHHLEMRVVMNTPGHRDGFVIGWFDGQPALYAQGLRFRDTPTLQIDGFYFQTHFGGCCKEWEPKKDEYIYYDDVVVSTRRIGPR